MGIQCSESDSGYTVPREWHVVAGYTIPRQWAYLGDQGTGFEVPWGKVSPPWDLQSYVLMLYNPTFSVFSVSSLINQKSITPFLPIFNEVIFFSQRSAWDQTWRRSPEWPPTVFTSWTQNQTVLFHPAAWLSPVLFKSLLFTLVSLV